MGFVKENKNKIIYSIMLSTIICLICYLLSSREVIFDIKNFGIILLLSILGILFSDRFYKNIRVIYILIVYAVLALIIPYIAYQTEPFYLTRLMKDFLAVYTFGMILLVTPPMFQSFNKKLLCLVNGLSSCLIMLPAIAICGYYFIANAKLSSDTIVAILQTDKQEAMEFINTYFTLKEYVILIILLVGFFSLGYCITARLFQELQNNSFNLVVGALCCVLVLSYFMFLQKTYFFRSCVRAKEFTKELDRFTEYKDKRIAVFEKNGIVSVNSSGNYALVIGETHARTHMNAAGYSRPTTPWLSKTLVENKAIFFNNGYSCAAQTEPALRYALTQKNQYNSLKYEEALTIVEMAKRAGFKVVWVTNQPNNTIAGLICSEADESIFLNESKNDTYMRQKNGIDDNRVLKYFAKAQVKNVKTLYVIHLLGSHAEYSCRYPESFNKWNEKESSINAYDNSILFNDYIMQNLTNKLFNDLKVDALMYFADHGEELEKYFCHGTDFYLNNIKKNAAVKDIVRIPVYFVFSDNYKQKHLDVINTLQINKNKYFTNDMVFDTLFGLMRVESNYLDKRFDLTSSQYEMKLDNMSTSWGRVKLQDTL